MPGVEIMIAMKCVMMCVLLSEGIAVKSPMKPDEGHALQHIPVPGYPERHGDSRRITKCFLSKSSTFTDPHMPGNYRGDISQNYWTEFGSMRSVEIAMSGYDCMRCLGYMASLVADLEEAGWQNRWEGYLPDHCKDCIDAYEQRTNRNWDRNVGTAIFRSQEKLMKTLANRLLDHEGISLYLDFADEEASRLKAANPGEFEWETKMGQILDDRVKKADRFVAWEGTGGKWCMGERAAAFGNGKNIEILEFPALGDSQKVHPAGNVPQVWADICKKNVEGEAFAKRVCELCGGTTCNSICLPDNTGRRAPTIVGL